MTPTILGPYELLERLGAGGMGVVYRARRQGSQADCALKVLGRDADEEFRERFRREGEALARLGEHPNLIRVHSASEEAGQLFLVMELVQGETLERSVADRLPIDQVLRIVRDLARGVQHVHDAGVLHRDIKPENVILTAEGVPKLVDFGLARVAQAGALTVTGELLGTPAYMAPEQAVAEKGAIGEGADVYGLGGLLFSLLAGRPPFEAASVLGLLAKVVDEPPPSLRSLRADIPRALDELCLRALGKSPKDRPSAGEFADALDAGLLGGFAAPSRRGLVGLAVALLALGVGVGLAAIEGSRQGAGVPPQRLPPQRPSVVPEPIDSRVETADAATLAASLQALREPLERLRRADDWLTRFPKHPREAKVRDVRLLAQRRLGPLHVLKGLPDADETRLLVGGRILRRRGSPVSKNAAPVRRWEAQTTSAALAVSADGTVLAYELDKRIEVRSTANLDLLSSFEIEQDIGALAFLPDGRRLAMGHRGPGVTVVNSADGSVLRELTCEPSNGHVSPVVVSPTGEWIAAASRVHSGDPQFDSRLIVWGAADVPYKVWSMSVMPRSLAFTGHGGEMVLGTQTGVLRVYDPERSEAGAVLTAGRTAKSVLVYNQAHTGRVVGLNTRDGVLFSVSGGSFKVAGTLAGTAHEDDGRSNDVAGWRRGPTGGWTNAGIYLPRAEAYTGIGRSSDGQTIMLAIGKNLVEVWPIEAFQEAPPR